MIQKEFNWRSFGPMMGAQATSTFIDYAFKSLAVLAAFEVMGRGSYANQAAFVSILAMAYSLPFIFLGGVAGYFSDRFRKRNVLLAAKVIEFLFLIFAYFTVLYRVEWGVMPMIVAILLLASQSVISSPAFNGLIPERFGEQGASHANGLYQMYASVAVILGGVAGFLLPVFMSFEHSTVALLPISLLGGISAYILSSEGRVNRKLRFSFKFITQQFVDLWHLRKQRPLFLAILGDTYFCALSTVVLTVLVVFCTSILSISETDNFSLGVTQLPLGIGVGLGSYFAGHISKKRIELGLIVYGMFGMMLMMFLIPTFPGTVYAILGLKISWLLLLWLFFLGFSGGVMIVPIRAFVQCRSVESKRGETLASTNILCYGAMFISCLVAFLLTAGVETQAESVGTGFIAWFQSQSMSFDPSIIFYILGVISSVLIVIAFVKVPDLTLRLLVLIIAHAVYRIRRCGPGAIPTTGPCVIISNHVSFLDGLLISTLTDRTVRFLVFEDYYRHPLLRPLARWARFIKVPANVNSPAGLKTLFSRVRSFLEEGEVVCIFPEGRITCNGIMGEFRAGYKQMIPKGVKVPLIPVHIGLVFGSMLTRSGKQGSVRFRFNRYIPLPMTLAVGNPIYADQTTPFLLRQTIAELGADAQMALREQERALHYRFGKMAKRYPFRRLVSDTTGRKLMNFQLFIAAQLLSSYIREHEKGQYVATLLPNSVGAAVSFLAILMADKTPAVLNFTASPASMDAALNHVKNPLILSSKKFVEKLKSYPTHRLVFLEDILPRFSIWDKLFAIILFIFCPMRWLMQMISPKSCRNVEAVGVVLYSSGSSGTPKAVQLTHHNLNTEADALVSMMGLRSSDSFIGALPLFHSYGFATLFWMPIIRGCKVVYTPSPLEAEVIGQTIETEKITLLLGTPTFLQNYYRKCEPHQFKTLRIVIAGGEKMRIEFIQQFYDKFGLYPIEGYGATELSPVVTINIAETLPDRGLRSGPAGSIGLPLGCLCIKIGHVQTHEQLPPNQEGLILTKGPIVMKGYLNEPDRTAEVLCDGWYNTNDMGYMNEDGYIFITGRLSRFSKIGGEMVPHEKIEQILLELAPNMSLRALAVSSTTDARKGERLVIVYTHDYPTSPEKCIDVLRKAEIPNLWIPKQKDFFLIDQMPLLGSGKLDLNGIKNLVTQLTKETVEDVNA